MTESDVPRSRDVGFRLIFSSGEQAPPEMSKDVVAHY